MPLHIKYFSTETHATDADGWDQLIGKKFDDIQEIIGFHYMVLGAFGSDHGIKYVIQDEDNHMMVIRVDKDFRVIKATVYNPVFSIVDGESGLPT